MGAVALVYYGAAIVCFCGIVTIIDWIWKGEEE